MRLNRQYRQNFARISAVSEKIQGRKSRLFVDTTGVFLNDLGTGIQRVAREVSAHLARLPSAYEVVRVYCDGVGYRECATGKEIVVCAGDIFFVLDQALAELRRHRTYFAALLAHGVKLAAFFHDLIPLKTPELCPREYPKDFRDFFGLVLQFPLIICNSASVATELGDYLSAHPKIPRNPRLRITHALLGCDFTRFGTTRAFARGALAEENNAVRFLMVSTVEPRKMYAQAVRAFTLLWQKGLNVQLWIVGRPGWRNEKTFQLIERSYEYGKRLLWYKDGISDAELASLYERSDAVLFASCAEGFGLSVAEGAHFGKPLILRDLPVFRELAGDNAFYFSGEDAETLAAAVEAWLSLYEAGAAPTSAGIALPTWEACSRRILALLTETDDGGV